MLHPLQLVPPLGMHPVTILASVAGFVWILRRILSKPSLPLPPGPKGRPILGYAGKIPHVKPWLFLNQLGKTYGDVCYFSVMGHPVVLLNSFDPVETLFNKRAAKYSLKPRRRMAEIGGFTGTIPFMNPGPSWNNTRKHFRNELSPGAMRRHYGAQESASQLLLRRISRGSIDLEDQLKWAFGELILRIACGHHVQDSKDSLLRSAEEVAVNASSILAGAYNFIDAAPFLRYLPTWFPGAEFKRTARRWQEELFSTCQCSYDAAKKEVEMGGSTSFLASVLTALGENISEQDVEALLFTTVTMHVGGIMTTHSFFLSFFLAMVLYPEIQLRAQSEVDSVVGAERLPTMADRDNLPYIKCLIQEVLRWNPVAPLVARQAAEDDDYEGYLIPKGATVVANVWSLTQDSSLFPDPQVFRPERHVDHDSHNKKTDPHYFTFGFGRRICPGASFSDSYLFLVVARILSVFNVSKALDDNGEPITPQVDYTTGATSQPIPFSCNIQPRSDKALALIHAPTAFEE